MKNWYTIKNRAEGVLDISLHEEIGMFGIQAVDFINEVRAADDIKAINLSINSPGGSVFDGLAIYNVLKAHPAKVHGHVEGMAASAASFILMASDVITMPENAFIMIHNAQGGAMGDADALREMADILEKVQTQIANIYVKRTGTSSEEVAAMMKVETWMNSADALENGFIDTVTDAVDIAAKIGGFSKHFKSLPIENNDRVEQISSPKDFEKYLRDSGLSRGAAVALTARAKVVLQGEPVEEPSVLKPIAERLDKLKLPG